MFSQYRKQDVVKSVTTSYGVRYDVVPVSFAKAYGFKQVWVFTSEFKEVPFTSVKAWQTTGQSKFESVEEFNKWFQAMV